MKKKDKPQKMAMQINRGGAIVVDNCLHRDLHGERQGYGRDTIKKLKVAKANQKAN
jgi:hypothetical protein